MTLPDAALAAVLAVAAVLVSFGAYQFHEGAGYIVGGLMLAAWGWLVLVDVGGDE